MEHPPIPSAVCSAVNHPRCQGDLLQDVLVSSSRSVPQENHSSPALEVQPASFAFALFH